MTDIIVKKVNEAFVRIETSEGILREMSNHFSCRMKNYRFHPMVKNGMWAGYLKFMKGQTIPIGLAYDKLDEFVKSGGYSIKKDWETQHQIQDWDGFVKSLNLPIDIKPWEHQIQYAKHALQEKNVSLESPTASGKSLILYLITRYLVNFNKKILIVVPYTSLVEQLYSDFEDDYKWEDCWEYTQKIYSGKSKDITKQVVITTWQSMFRQKKVFEQFDIIIIDEAHTAKAKSLVGITERCINAEWRIGLSGTYPESTEAEWYSIIGSFGPIKKIIDYQELKDKGIIADWEINSLILKHPLEIIRKNFHKNQKDYHREVDYINNLPSRNNFIANLVKKLKGNTIVLFTRIEHGQELLRLIQDDRETYYIDGKIDTKDRETIRKGLEKKSGAVLVGSFGTFSVGVNVKQIHNIVFASNYKSKIKVLQAIGRGLRKTKGKDIIKVYDIIDDLTYKYKKGNKQETYFNHFMRHKNERIKIYKKAGLDKTKTVKIDLIKGD